MWDNGKKEQVGDDSIDVALEPGGQQWHSWSWKPHSVGWGELELRKVGQENF